MKVISNSFIPNFGKDDLTIFAKNLFLFFNFKKEKKSKFLEKYFKEKFNFKYAFAFNSGRSALFSILKAIDLKKEEEVFVQCFTCNALLNPILALGGKPIFIDIDKNLNLDPENLKEKFKISKKPKAIIIQHTFGYPAQIEKIKQFAKEKNIILIEDCAHSLGAKYNGKTLGSFGDFAFFSFGRDKIVSSMYGGIAITNKNFYALKIKNFQKSLNFPKSFWTFRTLLTPIAFYLLSPIYNFLNIGKEILYLLRKLKITVPAVYKLENYAKLASPFPAKLPDPLAIVAINQLKKLEKLNNHRKKIALFYLEGLKNEEKIKPIFLDRQSIFEPIFMRFPILVENRKLLINKLKKENIYLEDGWSESVIVPKLSKLEKFNYIKGTCPKAEKISQRIINLPTNINISELLAKKIISLLKQYGS